MRTNLGIASLLALSLVVAGCKGPEAQLVGKWQVDTSGQSSDPQAAAMMKSLGGMMTIEFKSDKTFTGPMIEGTYSVNDHTVTMVTTKLMGMDISKMPGAKKGGQNETATLSDDGKTLSITSGKQPMKMVKATS